MENTKLSMGIWKFDSTRVTADELVAVAKEWAKDDKFTHLYLRNVSKDQIGLGYAYKLEDPTQQAHHKFFDKYSDELKRKFGNGLAGWDLSSDSTLIKGF